MTPIQQLEVSIFARSFAILVILSCSPEDFVVVYQKWWLIHHLSCWFFGNRDPFISCGVIPGRSGLFSWIWCYFVSGCKHANFISFNLYSISDIFWNDCYFKNINRIFVDVISIPQEIKGSLPLYIKPCAAWLGNIEVKIAINNAN